MSTTATLNIISPKLYPDEPWNESEVLGAITWLWYQSPNPTETRQQQGIKLAAVNLF